MKNTVVLLLPLFILALVACSAPEPTPNISATAAATVQAELATRSGTAPVPAPTAVPTFTTAPTPPATLTPTLVATQRPTPKATTTPYPTPTSGPTPIPTVSNFDKVPPDRIIAVGDLKAGPKFWTDREPFLLLGCHTDAEMGDSDFAFTQNGRFSESHYIAIVNGYFAKTSPPMKSCYSMRVTYSGTEEYCFYNTFSQFSDYQRYSCTGWKQRAPRFVMTTLGWAQKVSMSQVRSPN